MTPGAEPQSRPRPRIPLSAALRAAYAMAVAWVFYQQSMAWPHEGSMAYVVFFLLCPGIVFQSFNPAYMRRTGRRLTRRALTRLVTVPLGLVMAAFLATKLHHDSTRFVLAFQGGSADIDGSTIYYDSGTGAWRKFHNDSSDARQVYAGLTAGLAECVLVAK